MSGGDENQTDYKHIKALVRDIHVTKNVARPNQLIDITLINNHNETSNVHIATEHIQLPMQQRLLAAASAASIATSELDQSIASASSCDAADKYPAHKAYLDESGLLVPSVIITDATEPLDLFHSTQRRFSQLYSGLRRLSTSHTVRIRSRKKTNQNSCPTKWHGNRFIRTDICTHTYTHIGVC